MEILDYIALIYYLRLVVKSELDKMVSNLKTELISMYELEEDEIEDFNEMFDNEYSSGKVSTILNEFLNDSNMYKIILSLKDELKSRNIDDIESATKYIDTELKSEINEIFSNTLSKSLKTFSKTGKP